MTLQELHRIRAALAFHAQHLRKDGSRAALTIEGELNSLTNQLKSISEAVERVRKPATIHVYP